MKITGLRYERIRGTLDYEGPLGEERRTGPLEVYPEYRTRRRFFPIGGPRRAPPYQAASHLIAAQSLTTCPLQEWLIQSAVTVEYFLKSRYWPENGTLSLPPGPGLGMELDDARIESRELLDLS
jgi:hypothetical protein